MRFVFCVRVSNPCLLLWVDILNLSLFLTRQDHHVSTFTWIERRAASFPLCPSHEGEYHLRMTLAHRPTYVVFWMCAHTLHFESTGLGVRARRTYNPLLVSCLPTLRTSSRALFRHCSSVKLWIPLPAHFPVLWLLCSYTDSGNYCLSDISDVIWLCNTIGASIWVCNFCCLKVWGCALLKEISLE